MNTKNFKTCLEDAKHFNADITIRKDGKDYLIVPQSMQIIPSEKKYVFTIDEKVADKGVCAGLLNDLNRIKGRDDYDIFFKYVSADDFIPTPEYILLKGELLGKDGIIAGVGPMKCVLDLDDNSMSIN